MKKEYLLNLFVFLLLITSCNNKTNTSAIHTENWQQRATVIPTNANLEYGKSYLSVYEQVYSKSEHKTHNLTSMVSLRNTSDADTIYIQSARYYNTHGKLIKQYFQQPIYLAPMETTEIIIAEAANTGQTGANFIFEWQIPQNCPWPLFEAIMSSTMGQQGLSFTTQAIRIQ